MSWEWVQWWDWYLENHSGSIVLEYLSKFNLEAGRPVMLSRSRARAGEGQTTVKMIALVWRMLSDFLVTRIGLVGLSLPWVLRSWFFNSVSSCWVLHKALWQGQRLVYSLLSQACLWSQGFSLLILSNTGQPCPAPRHPFSLWLPAVSLPVSWAPSTGIEFHWQWNPKLLDGVV